MPTIRFAFSSTHNFIRQLALSQGDFIRAVHSYTKESTVERIFVEQWYDLGHINTYFHSRSTITTQRAFNSLKISDGIVWKSGTPPQKIEAEAKWFKNLPVYLKRFTPQLIQSGKTEQGNPFYETEYLPYIPLNEIFVHGKNPAAFWNKILSLIMLYMSKSRSALPDDNTIKTLIHQDSLNLYGNKTYIRLETYAEQSGLDLDKPTRYNGKDLPSVREIARQCIEATLDLPEIPALMHGDLCFSNILFDSRSNGIKVIDPRGLNTNHEFTIYGNQSYDLAKLCHSFIGMYDFIIADSFNLEKSVELGVNLTFGNDERLMEIQHIFMHTTLIPEISSQQIIAPTILLFLSMISLHSDKPNRQEAMLANALRMYIDWKGNISQ